MHAKKTSKTNKNIPNLFLRIMWFHLILTHVFTFGIGNFYVCSQVDLIHIFVFKLHVYSCVLRKCLFYM